MSGDNDANGDDHHNSAHRQHQAVMSYTDNGQRQQESWQMVQTGRFLIQIPILLGSEEGRFLLEY